MRLVILILPVFSLASMVCADWPQWRGPQRSGHVPDGVRVPAALPSALKVVWNMPVGDGLASPVVSGGRVFHLDNQDGRETIHALDAATGRTIWSATLDDTFRDGHSPPGPRCAITADNDRIYAQSCRGELQCLSAADGRVIWRINYVNDLGAQFIGEKGTAPGASRHGYNGAPLVDGDHLYVTAGGRGASMVCFDKLSGKIIWKSQDDVAGYAAPVMATIAGVRQVVYYTAEAVIGLDAQKGDLLWRLPVRTAFGRHVTTPVVSDDLVVVSSHQAGLIGIRISRSGDGLQAGEAWRSRESAINFASPVLVGEHLYGVGPQRNLICVDVRTGRQAWSKDGLFRNPGNAYAGMVVMGGNILVLTDAGQLLLIAADPSGYREISSTQACGQNWCNPAYSQGRLYLRDARELRCLELVGR
jgi:outer membrane protein assembly factor BamB